jgi:2,4-diaminopentanoate dehydrogenase
MPRIFDIDDVCRLLESGANVVTTCGQFHHPPSIDPAMRARVEELDKLTIDEYADLSKRDSPELLFGLMGFGCDLAPFQDFRADHLRSSFGPSLRLVADAVGLPLDDVTARGELATTPRETDIAAGTLKVGSVAAQRVTVSGIREGHELITFRATR